MIFSHEHLQLEMSMSTIRVSLDLNDIRLSKQNLIKAEQIGTDDKFLSSRRTKCAGLVHLLDGEYKTAAHHFISGADGLDYPDMITCADVILFGIICAVASFDRHEIRKRLIDNVDFKTSMENLRPFASASKNLAADFCSGNYSNMFCCLKVLYPFLRIDVHMSNHVDRLYESIKEKCIAQYFAPYSALDIRKMSERLQIRVEDLDYILVKMISSGQIYASIDSNTKTLYRRKHNELNDTYGRIVDLGKTHLRDLKGILLRLSFVKNGFSLDTEVSNEVGAKPLGSAGSFDDMDRIDEDGDGEMDIDQFDEENAP